MISVLTDTLIGVLKQMASFAINPFMSIFSALFGWIFGGLSKGLSYAWDNPLIKIVLSTANMFSWAIWGVAFLFFILKVMQEERRNWSVILNCFFKSILFIAFNQLFARLCFLAADMVVTKINFYSADFNTALSGLFKANATKVLLGIALLVALIIFCFVSIMRFSHMFIQMMIAPFYVPFILMGDDQKSNEWFISTISIGFTYLVQYLVFYCGITLCMYTSFDPLSLILGVALIFGTFSVPKLLQKFGIASSGGGSLNTIYMGGNMIYSMLKAKP